MSVKIADCSLRDGGYVGNKNFPADFIKGVMKGLVDAGVDYIETGFLQTNVTGETLVYGNSKDIRKYLPESKRQSEYVGFCDNSRYSCDNLDSYDGKSFSVLKLSFAKHEGDEALKFAVRAKEKGYKVFVQPMDASGYTMAERADMIKKVNKVMPEAFAIVDTFGVMHLDNLKEIFLQLNELLASDIKIALHTHNNLGLANALAEELINLGNEYKRDVVVDGSLLGMARGAGNACTEEIAAYVNSRYGERYNLNVLIHTIENYIVPVRKQSSWGYDLPMLICGIEGAHVDNISHLTQQSKYSYEDMYNILDKMGLSERKRYGSGYSKTDFTILDKAANDYEKGE